jgi:monothiol glutaredoxin
MDAQSQIKQTVTSNPVVLYMKGNPQSPQCGFSNMATQILDACNTEFVAVDVLADQAIREGIKTYSNWPTIPQLYVGGEFIGGSDIMRAMYESGELKTLLDALKSGAAN